MEGLRGGCVAAVSRKTDTHGIRETFLTLGGADNPWKLADVPESKRATLTHPCTRPCTMASWACRPSSFTVRRGGTGKTSRCSTSTIDVERSCVQRKFGSERDVREYDISHEVAQNPLSTGTGASSRQLAVRVFTGICSTSEPGRRREIDGSRCDSSFFRHAAATVGAFHDFMTLKPFEDCSCGHDPDEPVGKILRMNL